MKCFLKLKCWDTLVSTYLYSHLKATSLTKNDVNIRSLVLYLSLLLALADSSFDIFTDCLQSEGWTNALSSSSKKKTSCSTRSASEWRPVRRKLTQASRTSGHGTRDAERLGLVKSKLIWSWTRFSRARIHRTLWNRWILRNICAYCVEQQTQLPYSQVILVCVSLDCAPYQAKLISINYHSLENNNKQTNAQILRSKLLIALPISVACKCTSTLQVVLLSFFFV